MIDFIELKLYLCTNKNVSIKKTVIALRCVLCLKNNFLLCNYKDTNVNERDQLAKIVIELGK